MIGLEDTRPDKLISGSIKSLEYALKISYDYSPHGTLALLEQFKGFTESKLQTKEEGLRWLLQVF